jgi:hypothetical protein
MEQFYSTSPDRVIEEITTAEWWRGLFVGAVIGVFCAASWSVLGFIVWSML